MPKGQSFNKEIKKANAEVEELFYQGSLNNGVSIVETELLKDIKQGKYNFKNSVNKLKKPYKYIRQRENEFYKEGIKDNDYGFKFKPKHDQKAAKLSALRFYDEFKDKIEKMPKKKKSYNPFKSKRNKLVKAERTGLL